MSIVERRRRKSSNGSPGQFAPVPGEHGMRIKKQQSEPESVPFQQCTECGRGFRADLPGLCGICSGGDRTPTAAAERLMPLKTCDACEEMYGAELESCPACARKAEASGIECQNCGTDVVDAIRNGRGPTRRETKRGNRETKAADRETQAEPPKPTETGPTRSTDVFARLVEIEICEQIRENFDAAEIETLAKSIAELGLLQPPIVRRVKGGPTLFRLVAGERRIRALKLLGHDSCKARDVGEITDAQAIEIQGDENLKRKDLNDVERAKWYVRMTTPAADGGAGLTQDQLAKREGVTQAEISNRMRLLRCPQWALDLVISQQITRKHAMELLPFEKAEPILKEIEAETRKALKADGEGLGTVSDYRDSIIRDAVWDATSPIKGETYQFGLGGEIKYAIPAKQLEGLTLVDVPTWGNKTERRALEKKAAEKLLGEAKKAAIAKAKLKGTKAANRDAAKERELSPAERKQREKQQAEQHKARVEAWFHDWLRVLCAAKIIDVPAGPTWLLTWAALEHAGSRSDLAVAFGQVASRIDQSIRVPAPRNKWDGPEVRPILNSLAESPALLAEAAAAFTLRLLVDSEGAPVGTVYDTAVIDLARILRVDVAAAWRDDRKSAAREGFWNLHSKEQLLELGKELGVPLLETQKKSGMVGNLLGQAKPLPLPKSLSSLAGKVSTKKGGKR